MGHIIRNNKKLFIIIYINYNLFIQISKKSDIIITINTTKLNLKLILAMKFISTFFLDIKYKTNKDNIIPNTLLKLPYIKNKTFNKKDNKKELKVLFV